MSYSEYNKSAWLRIQCTLALLPVSMMTTMTIIMMVLSLIIMMIVMRTISLKHMYTALVVVDALVSDVAITMLTTIHFPASS